MSRETRHHLSQCYFIRGVWPLMKTWLQSAVEFLMCGRVAFSKHERNWARAPHRHHILTNNRAHHHPSSFSCWSWRWWWWGSHMHRKGPACTRPAPLSPASARAPLRSFVRAPAQTQGFREPGEQTSDSGGERKMEVRVGERLLCLAVLSSVLCVDSVFGKYVKGIINTKEVRADFSFFFKSILISWHLRQWHRHKLTGVGIGLDCVSARRCLRVGLFREKTKRLRSSCLRHLHGCLMPSYDTHSPLFCLAVARYLRAC